MYRTKRYNRYKSYASKYSNETTVVNQIHNAGTTIPGGNTFPYHEETHVRGITIVAPTNILGNRKCKNFTIKITANGNTEQIFGALVYVPEGTIASEMLVTNNSGSLYEPNQNVISSFIIPPNVMRNADAEVTDRSAPTQIVVTSRLSRNLNTGDSIVLIFASPSDLIGTQEYPLTISGTVNYAIKF